MFNDINKAETINFIRKYCLKIVAIHKKIHI